MRNNEYITRAGYHDPICPNTPAHGNNRDRKISNPHKTVLLHGKWFNEVMHVDVFQLRDIGAGEPWIDFVLFNMLY